MLCEKYKPSTQKSLFHKDIVNHIRKWIKTLETNNENNISCKQILFLQGPIGCAKTATVECLFKGFNLIEVDLDILSSNEKTTNLLNTLIDFNALTLENTISKKKNKQNIVFIDNIELCEKNIDLFVQTIHEKYNIPIILICNNLKYKNIFINIDNCCFLEFKKPSLLELNKLVSEISKSENLNLNNEMSKKLVIKSDYDIRQLFYLLEQWALSNRLDLPFDQFIDSISIKTEDKDIVEKVNLLLDYNKQSDLNELFLHCISEPQVISNNIYQNYNFYHQINDETSAEKNRLLLSRYSDMLYSLSESTIYHNQIFENQCWDLYNEYTITSCIIPSFYLKKNKDVLEKDDIKRLNIVPFKDISYNFLNSYNEVKRIIKRDSIKNISTFKIDRICDVFSCFDFVSILIKCMDKLNEYFEKNKKGKNSTKKEKLDLCNNITDEYKMYLDRLVNFIYEYNLYEYDVSKMNVKKYKDDIKIREDCKDIDLRVFKRILNIFTLDDSHKNFKSHIEISLQYKIFLLLFNDVTKQKEENKSKIHQITSTDLSEIWNF